MQRLFELSFCINGGKTEGSKIFDSRLPLKFKNEIYPGLLKKQQENIISQRRKISQYPQDKTDLPVVYKKSWFQKLKDVIKARFIKYSNQENTLDSQLETTQKQQFKEYISDMSNYSAESTESIETIQLEEHKNPKDTSELDL